MQTSSDPDPAFHFDANPDPTFHFDSDPDPDLTTHFFPDLNPSMLQYDLLRLWCGCGSCFSLWCGSGSYFSPWCRPGSGIYISIWSGSESYHSLFPRFGPFNAPKWPSKASTLSHWCGSGSSFPKWCGSGRIRNTASFYALWHLLGIGGQPKRVRRGWMSCGPWPPVWIAPGKEYQREKQEMSSLSQ